MFYFRILISIIVVSASVTAATYKGKTVDGVSYGCSIKQNQIIHSCSVVFDGKGATVKMANGIVTVRLAAEIIDDPKNIEGYLGQDPVLLDVKLD